VTTIGAEVVSGSLAETAKRICCELLKVRGRGRRGEGEKGKKDNGRRRRERERKKVGIGGKRGMGRFNVVAGQPGTHFRDLRSLDFPPLQICH
jgi:hypothetical protein